ncbi:CRISPR-associated protein Cas2 [Sphingomonas sp. Leaf412]|uniref:CRISPR-associated endonuclease Cas2 n=1 Tax=Sphingomonas sp. Leaf412 TaxID=1736370 RepID=UPI0006F42D6A|nr:CRISPR-associated endonuclease Cas2 [Sphingomonas sp. Leaf412]KQT32845.1 CRISPR-associated protein Cas2 [Sphingomonas sp. Leaf412]
MSDDAHLSGYRLMWIFVMFDLPVTTKQQSREATRFREFLLDQGFEMSQFSVYARFCNGRESYDSHLRRIEYNLPQKGEIHILTFTDKQYENIVRFSSQRRKRPRKNPDQLALF